MLRVGLTGGIGSGKSSVSRLLADRGAVVVDADRIARDVVAPGTTGLDQVADRFGPGVIASDGSLDRPALGAIVFADTAARRDLEGITHPLIGVRTRELMEQAGPDAIVIHDQPLLVEMGLAPTNHLTVVVGASEQTRVGRVVRDRGMSESDARARIEAQADDAARHEVADAWVDNDGTPEQLAAQVAALWQDRLVPFEENLRADRPVRPDTSVPSVLCEHRAERETRAARAIARIAHQLDAAAVPHAGLDHIGSTAVGGLVAKDVIDLQLRVDRWGEMPDELRAALRAAAMVGLRPMPGHELDLHAGGADPAYLLTLRIHQVG